MNYFAHGRQFVDQPYFLAGTALPDWLNVVNRRCRVRSRHALTCIDDPDPRAAAVAAGVLQHCRDDAWFHQTRAFAELSLELARQVRGRLNPDESFRPQFLGHILVEILLDACLIEAQPAALDAYYRAIEQVDGRLVQSTCNRMAREPAEQLDVFVGLFSRERFLWDYLDDGKLLFRLNQVMRRVKLPLLPPDFAGLFPSARRLIGGRQVELLTAPDSETTGLQNGVT